MGPLLSGSETRVPSVNCGFKSQRNLRNILATAPELTDAAVEILTDRRLIAKSLVMPFRFTTALEVLQSSGLPDASRVLAALSEAVDASLANVPRFEGRDPDRS